MVNDIDIESKLDVDFVITKSGIGEHSNRVGNGPGDYQYGTK